MKSNKFFIATALTTAALGASYLHSFAAPPKRPNVIIVPTDDQGYRDF